VTDLPPAAAASGARGYVHKEQFGGAELRRLWDNRKAGWPG
jgi:hypothetical protein